MDIFWYKAGSVQRLHHAQLKNNLHKILAEHDKLWIDIPELNKEEEELLRVFFNIHPLTIEDCAKTTSRPKMEVFESYVYIVLYGLDDSGHFKQLNFLLGNDYIITVQSKRLPSYESLKRDIAKLTSLLRRDTEFVMHHVIDAETDKYFPIIDKLDTRIEKLEERAMSEATKEPAREIFALKHQLLTLKHHLSPQKEIIFELSRKGNKYIMPSCAEYFRDVYDHIEHAMDDIENYREILNSTLDVHLSVLSNHMNDVIKVLTAISAILIPPTLIASIYGMNFRFMPELEWRYGYFVVLAFMTVLAAWMWHYFKRKQWI